MLYQSKDEGGLGIFNVSYKVANVSINIFQMYDKDGSGEIELSEMVEILGTVYMMEGVMSNNMAKIRAKQIFSELDINGDGSLTCDEFIQGCMKDEDMVKMLKSDNEDPELDQTSEDKTQKKNKKNKA